jgi:beta-barrel assembly-enhancing protease
MNLNTLKWLQPIIVGLICTVAGCANVPNLQGLSTAKLGMPSGSSSTLESVVGVAKGVSDSVKDVTEEEEVALGEQIMAMVLGAAPLYEDERVQRYVNRVGRWIASQSERPNLPWRFAVIKSDYVNAGAAPGGQIYISTGLLGRLQSEAELAGALAHEIAHVVKKHQLTAYKKKSLGNAALSGARAFADAKVKNELVKDGAKFVVGEIKTMILLSLDRGEEEQADRMGMTLAARAGYNPYGLPTVLQILQDMYGEQGNQSVLYATHPSPTDRLASLDGAFGKTLESLGSLPMLRERFIANTIGTPTPPAKTVQPSTKSPGKPQPK